MKVDYLEEIEMAILDLIQIYCNCSVHNAKFNNSTTSCSGGIVTFSSTLAHASDDGTVTATVLIDVFEAALAKADNPTITVDGQELEVSLLDEDSNSCTSALIAVGVVSAVLVSVMACIIAICG